MIVTETHPLQGGIPTERENGMTPIAYKTLTTRALMDIVRHEHGRKPDVDPRGRLTLQLIRWGPVPVPLMQELVRRMPEIRAILEAARRRPKRRQSATEVTE